MHPKIDFYLLKHDQYEFCFPFVCQLVSKIYEQSNKIKINCNDQNDQKELDTKLWQFSDDSFIPHEIYSQTSESPHYWILVGHYPLNILHINLQLNLQLNEKPESSSASGWNRLLQIVPNDPKLLELARQHYRFYRQFNYTIETHEIRK